MFGKKDDIFYCACGEEQCAYNHCGQCDYNRAETAVSRTNCTMPELCRTTDINKAILKNLHWNAIRQLKIEKQNEEILKQNAEIVEKLNLLAQRTR